MISHSPQSLLAEGHVPPEVKALVRWLLQIQDGSWAPWTSPGIDIQTTKQLLVYYFPLHLSLPLAQFSIYRNWKIKSVLPFPHSPNSCTRRGLKRGPENAPKRVDWLIINLSEDLSTTWKSHGSRAALLSSSRILILILTVISLTRQSSYYVLSGSVCWMGQIITLNIVFITKMNI